LLPHALARALVESGRDSSASEPLCKQNNLRSRVTEGYTTTTRVRRDARNARDNTARIILEGVNIPRRWQLRLMRWIELRTTGPSNVFGKAHSAVCSAGV
jgi:hypothetical protein